jgi:hypothetical protein
MNYIARIVAGEIVELREGVLDDIHPTERMNWRGVVETPAPVRSVRSPEPSPPTEPKFTVLGDRVYMNWTAESAPVVWVKMQLKKRAAATRWDRQQLPLLLPDGTLIDAAESSKAKIAQALTVLEKGWTSSIDFKAQNGWIVVDLAGLTQVAQYMVAREQALFTAEKIIASDIDIGVISTLAEVDNWEGWPV